MVRWLNPPVNGVQGTIGEEAGTVAIWQKSRRAFSGGGFSLWRGREALLGIDLGTAVTKGVILEAHGTRTNLKGWFLQPVAKELDPEIQKLFPDLEGWHAIRNSLVGVNTIPAKSGVAISGPRVLIKTLEGLHLSEEELREHLKWELDRYISSEMGEVVWDFYRVQQGSGDSPRPRSVYLVVAPRELVQAIVAEFNGQGLEIGYVDIAPFALTNMVNWNYGIEESWVLMHLGPSGILSVMIDRGQIIDLKELPLSGEWYGDVVDQMRFIQRCDSNENEKDGREAYVQALWEPFVNEVTEHIQDALHGWKSHETCRGASGVLLSGGYAGVEGLTVELSRKSGWPVSIVDPFKRIHVPTVVRQDPSFCRAIPLLGAAVGTAIREW